MTDKRSQPGTERGVDMGNLVLRIPYADYLGITVDITDGHLVTHMPFRDAIVGNHRLPAIHGGVVGAFLELAALFELLHRARDSRIPKPIDFNVNYLRSAGGHDSYARGEVVKHGRRIANVQVIAWQQDETKPVASGFGHFLL